MTYFSFVFLLISLAACHECIAEQSWSEGRSPYEGSSTAMSFKKETDNFSSAGKLKVNVESSYPIFQGNTLFIQEVNCKLHDNAKTVHSQFIQQFSDEEKTQCEFDEEAISMDIDKRDVLYILTPTYASSRIVSVFGELHIYQGLPHGSSRYYALNYFSDEKQIYQFTLEDLFLKDKNFIDFIIEYSLRSLKIEKVGYTGDLFPEINPEDLHVFTLSKNGLAITFQPYHIGGWADGPYSITIPFQKLMPYIKPEGPLDIITKEIRNL
jgi:hypothetical protein